MSWAFPYILVYSSILFASLLIVGFYVYVSRMRWEESERRRLERAELNLSIILRLMEAPDIRYLLGKPKSRKSLFLEYSKSLRDDVLRLVKTREIGFGAAALVGVFFLAWFLLRIKALCFLCGANDLRFLSGLELSIFRALPE